MVGTLDDSSTRRAVYEAALGLWRGEAYAEFAHECWALVESRRLEELRASAVEDLAALLVAEGEWTDAITRLEPLISLHPFRDRPRALLMRAYAESGRRVEALRAFQAYRTLLVEEVGTEPSSSIVALERDIARGGETELQLAGPNGQSGRDAPPNGHAVEWNQRRATRRGW
jgi:DNA-binding SARP family transcriptional activator